MPEYIERESFLAEQRHLYCENCARRKNSKGKLVYDIGDAPCSACDICDVLDAVEDAPVADVRPVVLCRDCKYNNACLTQAFVEEESRAPFDRNTFFCADGERRNFGTDMREES